jgi:rhodanese-related sulfurtransferase
MPRPFLRRLALLGFLFGAALMEKGRKVANAGGYKDWEAAGLPVKKIEPTKNN